MKNQKICLNRLVNNTSVLSDIICTLDIEHYFAKRNRRAKHPYDTECLVPVSLGKVKIKLTEREAHSVLLTMFGYTTKEVANYMVISPRTADHYLTCAREKLMINRKSALVSTLLQSDFIDNMSKVINKYAKKRK
jgi:DNA-binding CsgD family transcriptional regulator